MTGERVLVVDDEPRITRLVRDYLESAGFAVTSAVDGPEALSGAHKGDWHWGNGQATFGHLIGGYDAG